MKSYTKTVTKYTAVRFQLESKYKATRYTVSSSNKYVFYFTKVCFTNHAQQLCDIVDTLLTGDEWKSCVVCIPLMISYCLLYTS